MYEIHLTGSLRMNLVKHRTFLNNARNPGLSAHFDTKVLHVMYPALRLREAETPCYACHATAI